MGGSAKTQSAATYRPDLATFVELDLELQRRGYIAAAVMPVIQSSKPSDKYRRIKLASLLAAAGADTKRTSKGSYNSGQWEFEDVGFTTEEHGWEEPIDDRNDSFWGNDPEMGMKLATNRAWETVLAGLEQRVLDVAIAGVIAAGQVTPATAFASDFANADFISDIFTASGAIRKRTGRYANTVAMSRDTFRNVRRNRSVIDALQAAGAGVQALQGSITLAMLAQVFDVEKVVISDALKNLNNIAQDANLAPIFPNQNIWVGITTGGQDVQAINFGRIIHFGGDGSQVGDEQMIGVVETYRKEEIRSDVVRVRHETDEHVQYMECAQVITGVEAP